jgi:uncharacterized protein
MSANGLVIDVHQHVGPWPFPGRWGGIEENLRLMDARGIDVAVISSARAVVQEMARGNAELAVDLERDERLYGYVTLNPTVIEACRAEIAAYAANQRFIGFKVHTVYSGCAMHDPRLARLVTILEQEGKPLLIHTWGSAAVAALQGLAANHPNLPIIVAHAGGDAWREAIAASRACPNLYLDFACSTPYAGAVELALSELGPERIVFGTDATLFDPLYMRALFDAVPGLDPDARGLIMGGNAARLFRL